MTCFVVFGLSLSAKALVFQGLTNTPLGNASIVVACCVSNLGSGGQDGLALIITNLGSSGQDGVSVTLPANLTALDVHWEPLDVSNTLPVGAYIQEQAVGMANGAIGVLGTIAVTKQGTTGTTSYGLSANFSPVGASNFTVQAYLNGVLVAQATNQPGASLAAFPWQWIPSTGGFIYAGMGAWIPYVDWGSAISVSVAGANVTCDRLFIIPENVTTASAPTAFRITASQVSSLTIASENESQVYQALTNTSLGSASVVVACCVSNLGSGGQDGLALIVSNLSSSGQDGVSMSLPANLTALETHWEPLDVSNTLPVGAYIQEQVCGTANAITNGVLGTVTVTKSGTTNYLMSADFSPIGASAYTVQAYLHGILVAQATGQNGAAVGEMNTCISDWDVEIGWDPLESTCRHASLSIL